MWGVQKYHLKRACFEIANEPFHPFIQIFVIDKCTSIAFIDWLIINEHVQNIAFTYSKTYVCILRHGLDFIKCFRPVLNSLNASSDVDFFFF